MSRFDEQPSRLPAWKLAILKSLIGEIPCISLRDGSWHILKPGNPPDGLCTVQRYIGPRERAHFDEPMPKRGS